jgi:hypothetical protein
MHLSEREVIDAVEGVLTAGRRPHVDSCERCKQALERMSAVLRETRAVDVPEPSPLFWKTFTTGVLDAINDPAPAHRRFAWSGPAWRPAVISGAVTCVVIAFVFVFVFVFVLGVDRGPRQDARVGGAERSAVQPAPMRDDGFETDPEWTLLARVADGMDWESAEAAGLSLRPGAAERAAEQLSHDEQIELERLLRVEVGGEAGSL